jgi:hypothetical protein
MVIDTSGPWWRGNQFDDLVEYLRLLSAEGYPASDIRQSTCSCGGVVFRLYADADEGCAQRECVRCSARSFIGDSADYWEKATPTLALCPCGAEEAELAVGFSDRANGEVRWITVGQRCVQCGVLASSVDWKIDYAPTNHLRLQT